MRRAVVWASALALAGTAGTAATASRAAGATATARPGPAAPITLITGDRLIHPGSRNVLIQHAATSGPGRSFRAPSAGTHRYAFPVTAGPYLGRALDPALFDLSTLTPDGALKVHLTYRPGTANHDVPGVTVTRQTAGGADGYLTPESARRFGAALANQYVADQRTHDFGTHGLFAGVSAIRPASVPAPPVQPKYKMYTLSLNVLDQTGQPMADGPIGVVNVDDGRKFGTIGGVYQGVAKFSVPAGHYVIATEADVFNETTGQIKSWFVTLPQVTVTGNQSMTVDARSASSAVTATPPSGTQLASLTVGYERDAAGLGGLGWPMIGEPGDQIWVSPTAPVTIGTLHHYTQWSFTGTDSTYTAVFPTEGQIPANQSYQVNPADMATIDTGYASDRPDARQVSFQSAMPPGVTFSIAAGLAVTAPARRTEYVTGGHGIAWQKTVILDPDDFGGILDGSWTAYQAGQHLAENWGQPLRHPQVAIDNGVTDFFVPAATRRGDTMLVNLGAFGDNTPGHSGEPGFTGTPGLQERVSWALYAGDQQVAGADGPPSGTVTVPADPENYRLVLDADRSAAWWQLSTRTHTEWRFASAHQSGGSLPDPRWHCDYTEEAPIDCTVLPLLMPDYSVAGIGLDGKAPAGPSTLDVAVAPVQGAAPSAVASVTVEVSYNSGVSWTPATVTGSGNHFTATYTTPDPASTDGYVSVRTTATDAAGDAVTQTLIRAYALGS
ncbi:MAG: hypothetical protein ACJ73S_31040 [Mycobacteriales bacterium]